MSNEGLIYKKISLVMDEIGAIGKTSRNQQQGYAFRGIESFYNAAHPAMVKHGVFCAPEVIEHKTELFEKTNDSGKTTIWRHVTVKVIHKFYAEDGSSIEVTTMGEGLDNSDKSTNKAMSGAMKYALIELFCVPTEDVEDADRTTPEIQRPREEKPPEVKRYTRSSKTPATKPDTEPSRMTVAVVSPAVSLSSTTTPAAGGGAHTPPATDFITDGHQVYFARKFRESLPDYKQKDADILRHDFLGRHGFADKDGNPTSKVIPLTRFNEVVSLMQEFCKGF